MIQLLDVRSELTVEAVARAMNLPVTGASEHLRSLNARGLLLARRVGRFVYYRLDGDASIPDSCALLAAVVERLRLPGRSVEFVFRAVTGCTHPRRPVILRALSGGPMTFGELRRKTRISKPALCRHLTKLLNRRWLEESAGWYQCRRHEDKLVQTLMRLAVG